MKLKTLQRITTSKTTVSILFDRKNPDKWEANQKWIVSDFLYLNRDSLGITIDYSALTSAKIMDKSTWISLVKEKTLIKDKIKVRKLLDYYRNIIIYMDQNGEDNVYNYMSSRGLAAKLISLHFIDMTVPVESIDLDKYQEKFIQSVLSCTLPSQSTEHLLLAGPGSGKTTTLSHLIKQISITGQRILVLMYNRGIKDHMVRQLKLLGIKVAKNATKKHLANNQIVVSTIHRYDGLLSLPAMQSYSWDYCIVDEVHDINMTQYELIKAIPCTMRVYAGDYMQILYGDEKVMSSLDCTVHRLYNNYRSSKEIVQVLNGIPHIGDYPVQIPIYNDDIKVIMDESPDYQETVLKYLQDYQSGETFIISPISIEKFGIQATIDNILQYISATDPVKYRRIHRFKPIGIDGVIRRDTDYIMTSKASKGLERKQVILLGIDNIEQYIGDYREDNPIDLNILIRHIFVGMSRALERLVIITRGTEIRKDNPLYNIRELCDVKRLKSIPIPIISKDISPVFQVSQYLSCNDSYVSSNDSYVSVSSNDSQVYTIFPDRSEEQYGVQVEVPVERIDNITIVQDTKYIPFVIHAEKVGYYASNQKELVPKVFDQDDSARYLARSAYFLWKANQMDRLISNPPTIGLNRYILSVDDEYRVIDEMVTYYERAVTVYDLKTKQVIEAVNIVHQKARENKSVPVVAERQDCHRFYNDILSEDKNMTDKYLNVIGKYNPDESLVIHWAGMEGKNYDFTKSKHPAVKGKKYQCLDVRKIYESYLMTYRNIVSIEERHSSLDSSIQDIYGESMNSLLFHRAHEDTVATILVLIQFI